MGELTQLGVYSTHDEVVEAQQTVHVIRLSSSPAGRGLKGEAVRSQHGTREAVMVSPFPRSVRPQHIVGRRMGRGPLF
ncbi:hypothetical protein HPB50_024909 [Hyalomma asiaticum]|uniref:Uncharacterized protein n=1 Tax=Hyalomma asiaticum TaxID=266040 RepID=A0ACB7T431_HYAAI|nr:hypothetical protein HPB50_024909 [Hyalomma asiaticum]